MADFNPTMSIIELNKNGLHIPLKVIYYIMNKKKSRYGLATKVVACSSSSSCHGSRSSDGIQLC